jgi:sugar/nucleoside kinase (ribokinase family)
VSLYDIYGIGAALVDTEIQVSDDDLKNFSIEKGVMTLVDEARQHQLVELLEGHLVKSSRASGGSAANSIIAAAYLGSKTFYSCKVSNDENGAFYLKDLADAGVSAHQNNGRQDGITGKCLVLITPDAERTMNTFLGISESLSVTDIDETALTQSRYAYIEGYLVSSETGRAAAVRTRELAEQHGVKTALSLSDPAMVEFFNDGLKEMIGEKVDLLFCNKDEALNFTGCADINDASEKLTEYCRSHAITLGAEGALVFDGHARTTVPGVNATAVDTNGAGDMFAGTFLYALCQGKSYAEAAKMANRAAAMVVSQYGPRLKPEQHDAILAD